MTDFYSAALGLYASDKADPAANLDAALGYPPGYLNAAQWLFLCVSTPTELVESLRALEVQMRGQGEGTSQPSSPPHMQWRIGRRHGGRRSLRAPRASRGTQ